MNSQHALNLADGWKRRCLPVIVVLAAVIALSFYFLGALLCRYSKSHYDYLTSAPASVQRATSA